MDAQTTGFSYANRTMYTDNTTGVMDNSTQVVESDIKTVFVVFYLATFLFGLTGNGFVIYIIGYNTLERMKSVANYYIWSLAFADFLFVLSLPLFCWATVIEHWPFVGHVGDVSCKIAYACRDVTKFGSAWLMVALSVDRCLASFFNMQHLRTIRTGKIVILAIVLACLVLSLHYFYHAKTVHGSCMLSVTSYKLMWAIVQVFVGYLLPSVGICVAYCILWKRMKQRLSRRSSNTSYTSSSRNMSKTVLVVVVAFTICQTPYHVVQVIYMAFSLSHSQAKSMTYINAASQMLVFVSSCCNPIIYGLLNKNFRRLYSTTLCRCTRRSSRVRSRYMSTSAPESTVDNLEQSRSLMLKHTYRSKVHKDDEDKKYSAYTNQNNSGPESRSNAVDQETITSDEKHDNPPADDSWTLNNEHPANPTRVQTVVHTSSADNGTVTRKCVSMVEPDVVDSISELLPTNMKITVPYEVTSV